MKIDKLELFNYKGFENILFKFNSKVNLFIGVNGSGKTSFLDAMAIALSCLVSRIQQDKSKGLPLLEGDIRNKADRGHIEIHAIHETKNYCWKLTQSANRSTDDLASYEDVTALSEVIRKCYHNKSILPVIMYYPVSRVVTYIDPNTSNNKVFSMFDIYESALNGKVHFDSFFTWFRNQDDILNEQSRSQLYWFELHKDWITQKTNKIFSFPKESPSKNSHEKFIYNLLELLQSNLSWVTPQSLFMMLLQVIYPLKSINREQSNLTIDFENLERMTYNIISLSQNFSNDSNNDNRNNFYKQIISIITDLQPFIYNYIKIGMNEIAQLIVRIFSLAILLSHWWMSNEGREKLEILLSETFTSATSAQTYKNFELTNNFSTRIYSILDEDSVHIKQIKKNIGKELQCVRQAVELFIPEYTNLQVRRLPHPRMELTKNGETFNLNQLSDGEKNLIALIGDIAHRLTMANPTMDNPLEGTGIIMIDEIDLHLHPKWQRIVAQKLPQIFPNCQFFITTHSPQVISHIQPESIIALKNENESIVQHSVSDSYGKNSDRILEDIMDETARPKEIDSEIKSVFRSIQKGNIEEAQTKISDLRKSIGEDGELVKADVLIKRREIIGK